jgi:pimeloyl-ACP methyl ester carboxylesterase
MTAMYLFVGICIIIVTLPHLLVRFRESIDAKTLATGQMFAHEYGHTAYYDAGTGPVIVLLHGFGGWHVTWHALQPALVAAGYRVISIDALGAGASARPSFTSAYTTASQARIVIALLASLGITEYTLLGHSYGGRIALQIALLAPDAVTRIVALAPEALSTARPPIATLVGVPVLGYALAYWSTAPGLVQFGLRGVSRRREWVAAHHAHYALSARVIGHLRGQICQSAAPKDGDLPVPQHLNAIKCPVFLIWGEHDPVFPAQHGLALVERMENAHIGIIPNTGHIPHEEAFTEVMELLHQALAPTQPR